MIFKKQRQIISLSAISIILLFLFSFEFVSADSFQVTATVTPSDATNFIDDPLHNPGGGECRFTWNASITPNITNQRIELDDGSTINTYNYTFPGPGVADVAIIPNLAVGWHYFARHVSAAGSLDSPGFLWDCTPAFILPPPVLNPENPPLTLVGTSNQLTWTNGGINDATLECNIQASTTDLNSDPLTWVFESGWIPCPVSTETYSYTFNGLSNAGPTGTKYYYHVQSQTLAEGLSPFSNVESMTQVTATTAGGGGTPPPVAGGRPPRPTVVCGNGIVESGEQCDDGNTVSGDGCSNICLNEVPLKPSAQECGNSIVETGEQCDDGNNVSGDGCDGACQLEAAECGNGVIEGVEQCDDGNLANGDGCNDICELEIVEVIFNIKAKPEYRAQHPLHSNLGLNAIMGIFKPSIGRLDSVQVVLDNEGLGRYTGQIVVGTYDFAFNGEAHNTKITTGIGITPTTTEVDLDFTLADTWELTAGDTFDDNYVNALDIASMLTSYRKRGVYLDDLNKDIEPVVNALDIAILIWNYKARGDNFQFVDYYQVI